MLGGCSATRAGKQRGAGSAGFSCRLDRVTALVDAGNFLPDAARRMQHKNRHHRADQLEMVLTEPFAYSETWYERRGAMLVEIIGEDGSSGWSEAFGPPGLTAPIVDYYRRLLIGADAFATELH